MAAWAAYDAACLVRDGCPGPASPIGLRPAGLTITQLPVGLVAGLTGMAAAVALRRVAPRCTTAELILAGLVVVSSLRNLESIWLPSLGDGRSRQWSQSIAVFAVAGIGLVTLGLKRNAAARQAGQAAGRARCDEWRPAPCWATHLDTL